MLSFSILEKEGKAPIYKGSKAVLLQEVERELGMSIEELRNNKMALDRKYSETCTAKAVLGKAFSCNTILEFTWIANREMLKTIAEKCMRRMHDVDKANYVVKDNVMVANAQYFSQLFNNFLCNVEILWAMEYTGFTNNDDFAYMMRIANYYLEKTAQIENLMDSLSEIQDKKLIRA